MQDSKFLVSESPFRLKGIPSIGTLDPLTVKMLSRIPTLTENLSSSDQSTQTLDLIICVCEICAIL